MLEADALGYDVRGGPFLSCYRHDRPYWNVYCLWNRTAADDTLSLLYTWAEAIRIRERDRAIHRLASDDPRVREVIDDLTRVMVKKLLSDATLSIRECAERGDIQAAEAMVRALTQGDGRCLMDGEERRDETP